MQEICRGFLELKVDSQRGLLLDQGNLGYQLSDRQWHRICNLQRVHPVSVVFKPNRVGTRALQKGEVVFNKDKNYTQIK